jgi:hypothetical protein
MPHVNCTGRLTNIGPHVGVRAEGLLGRHRFGGRRSSLRDNNGGCTPTTAPPVSEVCGCQPGHVEVRDEERDRHKARRFTVAESVMKRTHFPLIVPSHATVEPQNIGLLQSLV